MGFDTSAFLIQFLGLVAVAGAVTGNKSTQETETAIASGLRILRFGLVIQLMCFGIFAIIGLRFIVVSKHWHVQNGTEWRSLAWAINACAAIIMVMTSLLYYSVNFGLIHKASSNIPSYRVLGYKG